MKEQQKKKKKPSAYATPQEEFWAGEFGDAYSHRVVGEDWVASNAAVFSKVLARTQDVTSILELGANIGLNLRALRTLKPRAKLTAVEINATAAETLREWGGAEVINRSLFEFRPDRTWDLVLVKGLLIHINPDELPRVYDLMHAASSRYVCLMEYYNPAPVSVSYRGHEERLFKRDFAGELLDRFPNLRLLDYGFAYRRDPNFPQDDSTWFLLEKQR